MMEDMVIAGTSSWLSINDNPSKTVDGHTKARKKKGPPPPPVYEPKGDSIENAIL